MISLQDFPFLDPPPCPVGLHSAGNNEIAMVMNKLKTRIHFPRQMNSGFTMTNTRLSQHLASFNSKSVACVFFQDDGEDAVCQGSFLPPLIDRARERDAPAAARGGLLIAKRAIPLIIFCELFDSGDVDGHIIREDIELDLLLFDSRDLGGDDVAVRPLLQGHGEGTPGILGGGEKIINALQHPFHRLFMEELIHGVHKIPEAEWMFW